MKNKLITFIAILMILAIGLPLGRGMNSQMKNVANLRPLAMGERDTGKVEIDFRIESRDLYRSVISGVLEDKSNVEDALRKQYNDPTISLKQLRNITVSRSGFGTTRFVYHLRFLFDDSRTMDLALYIFMREADRSAEAAGLKNLRGALAQSGPDNITLSQFGSVNFEKDLTEGGRQTFYCTLAEYGGVDLAQIRRVFRSLFKEQTATLEESELYALIEMGIITDQEAQLLKTDKASLSSMIKTRLKTNDIDEFMLRMDYTAVTKYFQLYRRTGGSYVTNDPRRDNILFRYDAQNEKWNCRLCDYEDMSSSSLAEFISAFEVFNKIYYEPMRVGAVTVRHSSSASVRAWHWTDQPIPKKMGFFQAAVAGLGDGNPAQAVAMLDEAQREIAASTLLRNSDNSPYETLIHFLIKIGHIGTLKFVAQPGTAFRRTAPQLEASI